MQERGQKGSLQLGPMPSKALVLRLLSEGLEEPGHPPTLPSGKLRGQPGLLVALGAPSLTLGLSPAPQLSYGTRDRQTNRWRPRLGALLSPHLVPHLELCIPKTITAGGGLACQPTGWTGIMETSPVPDIPLWAQRKRGKGRLLQGSNTQGMHSFTVLITCATAISWAPQFACLPGAAWGAGVRAENKAETVPATDSHFDSGKVIFSPCISVSSVNWGSYPKSQGI